MIETNNNIIIGRVKWFNHSKGYGFINILNSDKNWDTSTKEIFVHHSNLQTNNDIYRVLNQGEYIEFIITKDKTGKEYASNVRGIYNGPLLCESASVMKNTLR
jgi:CspA family cold shock protein